MYEELTSDEQKAHAIEDIEAAFDLIASEQREPNRWERVHLAQAINDVVDGRYPLAGVVAYKATTPRTERSEEGLPSMDELVDFTLDQLRDLLMQGKAAETRQHSRF